MFDVFEIANFYLSKESMTNKKLQKMLYFAYSWYMTIQTNIEDTENEVNYAKLFDEEIQAWVHGPVIPRVYDKYKEYGYTNIPQIPNEPSNFDFETTDILAQVWEVYGKYNGNELENITHQHDPWILARKTYGPLDICREVIKDVNIFNFYIQEAV